jgi:hypothetical protein
MESARLQCDCSEEVARDAGTLIDKQWVQLYRGYGGQATPSRTVWSHPHPTTKGFYEDAKSLPCKYGAVVF